MWPPAEVVAAVAPLGRVAPERLHVTLRFLGADRFEGWPAVLPGAVAQLGSVTATFGRTVLHVPVAGLEALAAAVAGPDPGRPFVGHLTLARARRREDLRRSAGQPVPAAACVPWPVTEVTLVASVAGRYEVLERRATG